MTEVKGQETALLKDRLTSGKLPTLGEWGYSHSRVFGVAGVAVPCSH